MANLFKFVGTDNSTSGSAINPFGSGNPLVNDKKLKRYDYAEVKYPKEYNIDLNDGVLGFFKKLC